MADHNLDEVPTSVGQELPRHMDVVHKEILAALDELREKASLRREMRAGFAEMRELFRDHTIPGDAFDKQSALTLSDHERRIQILEQAKQA